MAFDGITVRAVVSELSAVLTEGRIAKISEPEKDELMLTVKLQGGGQARLLISVGASLPFLCLTDSNRPSPAVAPAFTMLLRKYLQGGKILSVKQPSLERIVRIEVERRDELGDLRVRTLVAELMGKHSNIIFVDEQDTIIDSIKRIPPTVSSVREVLPGRPYFVPKQEEKTDPLSGISRQEFEDLIFKRRESIEKVLFGVLIGFSPASASELLFRAGIDPDTGASSVTAEERNRLYAQYLDFLEIIEKNAFTPCIIYDGDRPVDFCAYEPVQWRDKRIVHFPDMSGVLRKYYEEKDRYTRIRQRSADLRKIVANAIERTAKKLDLQQKQLADTEKMDRYRIYGELINTYGYSVEDGSKSFEAENFYTGEKVTVPLDPMLSVHENANRYFERYQKLKRTRQALGDQIGETENCLLHLRSVQTFLEIASSEEDLRQIAEELADTGYIRHKRTGKGKKEISRPLHYVSSDGFDIYVGKNNYQNDELTFKASDGRDWWFHSKKFPGSHVLLKAGGAEPREIPDRTFNEAGRLAAFYSAGRGQEKVEIDYTQKKNVKKPGGAVPGFVVYYTNYSMMIAPDITGIRKV